MLILTRSSGSVLLDSQALAIEFIVVDAGEASFRLAGMRSATSRELGEGS